MTKECVWNQEDEESDTYHTNCNHMFTFTEGGPQDNGFEFCCFCGDKLVEVKWEEPEDEDEDEDGEE